MSRSRYPSRRRLRSEILPLFSVLILSLSIFGLFPRETLDWGRGSRAAAPSVAAGPAGCAFVTLTREQEDAALSAARTSWQTKDSQSAHRRIEMLPAELPAATYAPVIDLRERPSRRIEFRVRPQVGLLPPTAAAARPARIGATDAVAPQPAFPRETMLELR